MSRLAISEILSSANVAPITMEGILGVFEQLYLVKRPKSEFHMCSIESKPLDTPSFILQNSFHKRHSTKPALATCSFVCSKKYDYFFGCKKRMQNHSNPTKRFH